MGVKKERNLTEANDPSNEGLLCRECEYRIRCLADSEGHMVLAWSVAPCPRTEAHSPHRCTVTLR